MVYAKQMYKVLNIYFFSNRLQLIYITLRYRIESEVFSSMVAKMHTAMESPFTAISHMV